MSDAEWAAHVRKLEQSNRHDQPGRSKITQRQVIVGLAAAAAVAGGIVYVASGGKDNTAPEKTRVADLAGRVPFSDTPADVWKPATAGLVMPRAVAMGPYSATEVAGALARARTYLLTAHTSPTVLTGHNLTSLHELADPKTPATVLHLYAVELAPGNTLAAQPRLTGTVAMAFVPKVGKYGEYLEVTTNLLWAYALKASYPVYETSDGVVTMHEHMKLDFYLDKSMDGPKARVVPTRDQSLEVNGDCAYSDENLIGLPRVDDPKRSGGDTGERGDQYDVNASVTSGSFGCV